MIEVLRTELARAKSGEVNYSVAAQSILERELGMREMYAGKMQTAKR